MRGLLEEEEARSPVSADGGAFTLRDAVRPDTQAVAVALARGATLGDPTRWPRRDLDDLARLRPEDILRAARRVLDPRREVLAVVRPQETRVRATAAHGTVIAHLGLGQAMSFA